MQSYMTLGNYACAKPMMRLHSDARTRSGQDGFSLVEAMISVLVVAVIVVAAMHTVGGSQAAQLKSAQRDLALMLAEDLMDEIMLGQYEEPVDPPNFGRESGESGSRRDLWDDVDDYDGWSASPPEHRDGTAIPNADSFTRQVEIVFLDPNDLVNTVVTDQGIKRVRVTVKHGDRALVTLTAVRTLAWKDPQTSN